MSAPLGRGHSAFQPVRTPFVLLLLLLSPGAGAQLLDSIGLFLQEPPRVAVSPLGYLLTIWLGGLADGAAAALFLTA